MTLADLLAEADAIVTLAEEAARNRGDAAPDSCPR